MLNKSLITIPDLVDRWGWSRNSIWKRCKSGEIPATKIGERWFIQMDWVVKTEQPNNQSSTSNLEPNKGTVSIDA